jgi:hypothetical protein
MKRSVLGAMTMNPIGIEFDANELNEKRKTGTPYAELVQYGTA